MAKEVQATTLPLLKQIPFFEKFLTPERFAKVSKLAVIAEQASLPMVDLALGWLAHQPSVASIIAGATSAAQVRANVKACATPLDRGILNALDQL